MKNTKIIFGFIFLSLIGCASTSDLSPRTAQKALQVYIAEHDYVPFVIPRDSDGAGAIITFENEVEATVAAPNECILGDAVQMDTLNVALPDLEYALSETDSLELSLAKALNGNLDLGALFGRSKITSIIIRIRDPFETRITRVSTKRRLEALESQRDTICLDAATAPGHLIIERTLGLRGLEYVFLDSSHNVVNINASHLGLIGLNPSRSREFEGSSSLNIDQPMLIGYRTWAVKFSSGFIKSEVDLFEVKKKDVLIMRQD